MLPPVNGLLIEAGILLGKPVLDAVCVPLRLGWLRVSHAMVEGVY